MKNWNNSDELAIEYANDLKALTSLYNDLKEQATIYYDRQKECEQEGKWDESIKFKKLKQQTRLQMKEIGPIVSSSRYSIQWLRRGSEPTSNTPVSKLSYEQRTTSVSNVDQSLIYLNTLKTELPEMDEEQLFDMRQRMHKLSNREYDVYVSIKGKGNTYEQTAGYLSIKVSTVSEYMKRAEKKLARMLEESFQGSLF